MTNELAKNLEGLSDAELEYAYRYWDYLTLGDEKPDQAGFTIARIVVIQNTLDDEYRVYLRSLQ